MALGETLIGKGLITNDQLQKALEAQKANPSERLGAILVRLGFITQAQLDANMS
jgi:hypothetical protein